MEDMQIVYLSPKDLKPYENNTSKHNPDDIDGIKKSILAVGFRDPIGIWGKENLIVEGHGRQLAALELGIERVPCIRLDDMTDEQRKEYAIRHNRTAELSSWDFGKLGEELADLELQGVDMSDLNFDLDALGEGATAEFDIQEDEVPEAPEEPKAKRDDIYQLGRHRLMCGDSTSIEDLGNLIGGNIVDCVYTDPPYGMNLDTDYSSMVNKLEFAQGKSIKNGKKYDQGIVDDFDPKMVTVALSTNAKEVFLWGANYYAELLPDRNGGSWFVWDKRSTIDTTEEAAESADKMYGSCFELCWSKKAHKQDIARVKWAGVFGTEKEFDHKRYHPTQKPIKLSAWFISRYTSDGDNVLDLFGGSGSTLIACEQLNRACYMMELDPHYVDVIIQRWEKLTGEKAVLLNG